MANNMNWMNTFQFVNLDKKDFLAILSHFNLQKQHTVTVSFLQLTRLPSPFDQCVWQSTVIFLPAAETKQRVKVSANVQCFAFSHKSIAFNGETFAVLTQS